MAICKHRPRGTRPAEIDVRNTEPSTPANVTATMLSGAKVSSHSDIASAPLHGANGDMSWEIGCCLARGRHGRTRTDRAGAGPPPCI
jgi:hypothetical protein